ncbi:hypothetical protein [Streptomyces alanosinicus]|uniref:Uncharacterized protein n=1 Tax=Streptomyces alanosinicus TaxID=68171 RepID=A0A918YFS9_9ACTN|nr:hypothetical protein [Streptomyces alanosinicus]GHE00425.1 hypothetical protein GCM10010339_15550 [Streptomyces alanosinicus]
MGRQVGRGAVLGVPWEVAESLWAFWVMGVDQVQVWLRSRGRVELVEQVGLFGAEVAPLLG